MCKRVLTQLRRSQPGEAGRLLLDLLLVKRKGLVGGGKVVGCFGPSDHEMVELSILETAGKGRQWNCHLGLLEVRLWPVEEPG